MRGHNKLGRPHAVSLRHILTSQLASQKSATSQFKSATSQCKSGMLQFKSATSRCSANSQLSFFASEAQACACGARHQLEQQREKEQRARDWAAAAELRVCLLEQQHLAVQRMADEAERRAREAEEHREAERRMADEAKRRAREAEEHYEAERRMADEEERRVCASLGITLQYSGSELDSSSWRHVADEAQRRAKEAKRRERRAA